MLDIFFKSIRDTEFQKIETPKLGSWIHVSDAAAEDLEQVSKLSNVSIEELTDSLDIHEIPRIEKLDNAILIFTRHPAKQELGLHTQTLTIVLTENYVITISPDTSELIEEILAKKLMIATTQKSKFLLHILLRISAFYTNIIKRVRNVILNYGQQIKEIDNSSIILLTQNEEILNQYLTSLVPMRNLMGSISSGRYVNLYEKDYHLLQDLTIAINQSEDLCRVNIKSIRSLRDSYQIVFTNDVNKMIKKLTAITIIFTIPTIIASVYGMNVSLPMDKNPMAFYYIMGLTCFASLALIWVFSKKRWI